MLFSNTVFLFLFLPLVLIIYYLLPGRTWRNVFLTLSSLFAYAWGEPSSLIVMLASVCVNHFVGLRLGMDQPQPTRKRFIRIGLVFNIGLLAAFKYAAFAASGLNAALGLALPVPQVMAPLGISYFTFMAISYVMDVYAGKEQPQRSLMNMAMYLSLFTKLPQGPIVQYASFPEQIDGRRETMSDFTAGARRFMVGLAKKIIIADNLALMVNHAYGLPDDGLSVGVAWIASVFFHVQVFYDWVGYTDMALGLSQMFGFHFMENFNYPMLAKSVTDFWRRWHISLCMWFRNYLFFPLGGSRVKSKWRLAFNMLVVWLVTGLWHGATWSCVLWGLSFFMLLVLEKMTPFGKWIEKHWLGYVYSNVAVCIVTVVLRAVSVPSALARIGAMFGAGATRLWDATASMYLREYGLFMAVAVLLSVPFGPWLEAKLHIPKAVSEPLRAVAVAVAFIIALSYMSMGSFSAFVYRI